MGRVCHAGSSGEPCLSSCVQVYAQRVCPPEGADVDGEDAAAAGAALGGAPSAAMRGGSGPLRLLPATLTFCSLGSAAQVGGTEPAYDRPLSLPCYLLLEFALTWPLMCRPCTLCAATGRRHRCPGTAPEVHDASHQAHGLLSRQTLANKRLMSLRR